MAMAVKSNNKTIRSHTRPLLAVKNILWSNHKALKNYFRTICCSILSILCVRRTFFIPFRTFFAPFSTTPTTTMQQSIFQDLWALLAVKKLTFVLKIDEVDVNKFMSISPHPCYKEPQLLLDFATFWRISRAILKCRIKG